MIYAVLTGTERGDLLIMSESVIALRNWVDTEHPDLVDALTIFRPHQVTEVDHEEWS
jgi:hypothetical protein